ncbi:MAG TPA: TIGR04551 family protein [Polyangiaceae bacterium]|nr:TIGR04551 family protein [Polyangiaceae bacterium]
MRFRINPELHISDNLRVISQIDMLDNLVLGSTPSGYSNHPSSTGGYAVSSRNGYNPLGFYDETEEPPSAGVNSSKDSIRVKRAWAEYSMPVGEIRFGRMPWHWGLGMMFNSGDNYDDDAQSTIDRVQITTGIKPLDLYFSAAWDFPNEGITSDALALPNPEPYDLGQLDDVDQYVFSLARRKTPQLERQSLSRGDIVINAGLQVVYRHQTLANDRTSSTNVDTGAVDDTTGDCGSPGVPTGAAALGCPLASAYRTQSLVRRDAHAWIPDLWLQLKYKKFRFEAEGATVQGAIANIDPTTHRLLPGGDPGYKIRAWGLATEMEQKLIEDKLSLQFKFGWASGDPDVDGLAPIAGNPAQLGTDRTFSTFRFHPSYRVDMILGRSILTRQQGTYYFRPSADYDFLRDPNGQRLGGGLAAIWTRASEFIQAPGHERDLGIELNGKIYFQSKDGALNDIPGILGGFYTEVDYGVLFPMAGLGYPDKLTQAITDNLGSSAAETRIAQTLRWYLGVLF